MTRIIALANQKGGTGKTTTAVNLAACLAERGRSTLLVDLDPQGNATEWTGLDGETGYDLLEVFMRRRPLASVVRESATAGLSVVPSGRQFARADLMLATDPEGHLVLKAAFDETDLAAWDYVLIDCPPNLSICTANALNAAREVVIPTEANRLSTSGIEALGETIARVRKVGNADLRILGILLTRYDRRKRVTSDFEEALLANFGSFLLPVRIRQNARLEEAPSYRKPISAYEPRSAGTEDYRALAAEIDGRGEGGTDRA